MPNSTTHSPVLNAAMLTTAAPSAADSTSVVSNEMIGLAEKAITKVRRYSASGATHRKGADATSTDRCAVTPSIRLEGAAASSTSTPFSRQGIGAEAASLAGSLAAISRRRQIAAPSTATMTTNSP